MVFEVIVRLGADMTLGSMLLFIHKLTNPAPI